MAGFECWAEKGGGLESGSGFCGEFLEGREEGDDVHALGVGGRGRGRW